MTSKTLRKIGHKYFNKYSAQKHNIMYFKIRDLNYVLPSTK